MKQELRVGIIGASADRGWAKDSHVPAVQKLAGLELAAVATGKQETADAAARAFGAKAAYGNAKQLIQDSNVDLVAICVKVPDHRELVLAALAAGKHIYCEWPLGRSFDETEELAVAAQTAGVHAAIGLQTRVNPAALRARDLIAAGAIGRVLNTRILSSTVAFGPKVETALAFAENAANGVTLITIQGAHTIDLAIALLGKFDSMNALATTQYPEVEVGEVKTEAKKQPRSTADHLFLHARVAGGSAVGIEVTGGCSPDSTPFRLEVTGELGSLLLEGGAARGFQSGRLSLSLNGKPQQVDEGETQPMSDTAANVAGMYAALRDDILSGTSSVPDFHHAARLTRLIDDVMSSAQ